MKKTFFNFIRRGLVSCGLGPLILAVLYLILQHHHNIQTLTVTEVCVGIISLSALAFIAGGSNEIYQIERLPLVVAIFIHGSILYLCYLGTYLINGWLELGTTPILVFSAIFVFGFLAIWAVIYFVIRQKTAKINAILKEKQNQP